jgi:hypothetical protein
MKLTLQKVANVLLKYPSTKDDDRQLCVYYWHEELIEQGKDPSKMDIPDFFLMYTYGGLTDAQTITRLRRKLQMERPQFRGERWKAKQANQEKVKKDLGYGQTMDQSGNGFTP